MSTLSQFFDKAAPIGISANNESGWWASVTIRRLGECAWGLTALALFLVMGPFAVIAVIAALVSMVPGQEGKPEPKSIVEQDPAY